MLSIKYNPFLIKYIFKPHPLIQLAAIEENANTVEYISDPAIKEKKEFISARNRSIMGMMQTPGYSSIVNQNGHKYIVLEVSDEKRDCRRFTKSGYPYSYREYSFGELCCGKPTIVGTFILYSWEVTTVFDPTEETYMAIKDYGELQNKDMSTLEERNPNNPISPRAEMKRINESLSYIRTGISNYFNILQSLLNYKN